MLHDPIPSLWPALCDTVDNEYLYFEGYVHVFNTEGPSIAE